MELRDFTAYILTKFNETYNRWPGKTQLIKLIYLSELFYKRKTNKRILDVEWVYYLYGPYLFKIDEVLDDKVFEIESIDFDDYKTKSEIKLRNREQQIDVPFDIARAVVSVVRDYGSLELSDLLDFVYFQTEPMISAEHRLEKLDFNNVLPEKMYVIHEYKIKPKDESKLRNEFREKLKKLKSG